MNRHSHQQLADFAKQNGLLGLSNASLAAISEQRCLYTINKAKSFLAFQQRIDRDLLHHPIITQNTYTAWFGQGKQNQQQIIDFVIQFSVFSNLFLVAQLYKTINADSVSSMRASKEILANEIGVVFKTPQQCAHANEAQNTDPEWLSTQGSIEGGQFRFRAAHFEWLLMLAEKLGLCFQDVGKRIHGSTSTLFYCDELSRLYGSEDYLTCQAASYAVENWAAAGFWDALIEGFQRYNHTSQTDLPITFFTWHSRIEAQHALHTQEELETIYFKGDLHEEKFIRVGNKMLDGVAVFWEGLDQQRRVIAKEIH